MSKEELRADSRAEVDAEDDVSEEEATAASAAAAEGGECVGVGGVDVCLCNIATCFAVRICAGSSTCTSIVASALESYAGASEEGEASEDDVDRGSTEEEEEEEAAGSPVLSSFSADNSATDAPAGAASPSAPT